MFQVLDSTSLERLKLNQKELRCVSFLLCVQRFLPRSQTQFNKVQSRFYELYVALRACIRAAEKEREHGFSNQVLLDAQSVLERMEGLYQGQCPHT